MKLHFYHYCRNFAIGFGVEKTFNNYYAIRLGLGFWCLALTINRKGER